MTEIDLTAACLVAKLARACQYLQSWAGASPAQCDMPANLQPIADALAALTETELLALQSAVEHAPPMAPGLLAYLEHACDYEAAKRAGQTFPLREPREAIPHEELGQSFATIAALMMHFTTHPCVRALIEAVGDELVARPPETMH